MILLIPDRIMVEKDTILKPVSWFKSSILIKEKR
jgi:hypothetical protein